MTNNDLNDSLESTLLIDNHIFKTNSFSENNITVADTVHTIFLIDPNETQPTLLTTVKSMAQACQLSEETYQIISATLPWHQLKKHPIKNIILFGSLENRLGLNVQFPIHYIFPFDQCTWIKTLNLAELSQDKAAKTALWNTALKKHFIS